MTGCYCTNMDTSKYVPIRYSRGKGDIITDLPVIPRLPEFPTGDGAIAICGECGLRLMPVMGYVCPNIRCPCFPRNIC